MKIARLDGSTISEIADHKSLFPNTSFPKSGPDATWLAANGCAEVVVFLAFDSATQKNEAVTPYLSDGKVYTRRVTDMTSEEQAAVVTAAVPSAWVTYRTALRDITAHANWPNLSSSDIDGSGGDWPVEPS